ncbi:MAG: N-acetylmuramoyl-L-alanine amidase [Christensenella sp.]|uniref:N-acetylmuramoyl-L-alanine amidase family protein n=1 Tax=Christensenella sp. TaxID=1935934 RepID=UPI002B1FA02F|nr:N-acetylmuramoyl-L-alanine amidase [Christensenella sp.]MEA5003416.1 N-acetylmuramoyl-L-alanine amidase [Christensenella sp.]
MRFKRLVLLFLAGVMLLALVACGKEEAKETGTGLPDLSSVSIKGLKIIVDPGHGDTDVGTIGVSTGGYEKEVNLEISLKLKDILEKEGVTVIMTRDTDDPVAAANETDIAKRKEADMQRREQIITDAQADMYIGVHQNSFEDEGACGPQIFYHTDSNMGAMLAKCVQTVMNEELTPKEPRKPNCGRYRLLKPGKQPSVTVECGFFTNPEEEKKLQDSSYQDQVVGGIVDGIKYFEWSKTNAE